MTTPSIADELAGELAYRASLQAALKQVADNGGADFVQITTPSGAQRTVRYNLMQLTKLIGIATVKINDLQARSEGKDRQSTSGAPTFRTRFE